LLEDHKSAFLVTLGLSPKSKKIKNKSREEIEIEIERESILNEAVADAVLGLN
jgi:hypothetical protein